jgi:hypothetical protein
MSAQAMWMSFPKAASSISWPDLDSLDRAGKAQKSIHRDARALGAG